MATDKRIAFTVPPSAFMRLAALLASMVQEGLPVLNLLVIARQALLIGLTALEWARRPEGTPDGIRKLIRTALDPGAASPRIELDPNAPKAETPVQRAWRTWRTAYLAAYARPYVSGTLCGRAMTAIGKLGAEACARMGHDDDADLEALFAHWWRAYLADPGYSKGAGDPGFLRANAHGIHYFSKGIQQYGTPWDREVRRVMRPALAPAPTTPRQLAARRPGQSELFGNIEGAKGALQAVKGRAS